MNHPPAPPTLPRSKPAEDLADSAGGPSAVEPVVDTSTAPPPSCAEDPPPLQSTPEPAAAQAPPDPEAATIAPTAQVNSTSPNPASAAAASAAKSTRRVALGVLALLALLIAWQIASDRWVPYTARGAVAGYVAQLTPRVAGQVTEVAVQDGVVVQAGDVLAQLDPTPFDLAERQAEAALSKALQSTRATATGIVVAQAGVTAARAQRENVLAANARTQELVARGFLSAVKSDDARAAQRNADAQLDRAQAELERSMITAGARGTGVNPEVRVAQLQLERAQLDKRFATLTAPTRGVVTNLRLAVGQYVAPGTPAMTFIDARGAWITADLRENQLGNVQIGDAVGITFDAAPGTVFKGRVQSIAWGIDVGRSSPGGLLQNLPEGQWFEPARRIPVHIELDGSLEDWPRAVRIGGKAGVVIYAEGRSNPVAWLASGLMQLRAWLSYLY